LNGPRLQLGSSVPPAPNTLMICQRIIRYHGGLGRGWQRPVSSGASSVNWGEEVFAMRKTLGLVVVGLSVATAFASVARLVQTKLLAAANTGVIQGVVTSEKGPEAGVWVIAETDDLQTKFR